MAMYKEFQGFEHLYDARILTEDGYVFPVHRVLLSMKSEYFHDLLCNSPLEHKDVLIPGIRGSTMDIVINYIYTGRMNLEGHEVRDILVAAYFLGIENLLVNSRNLAVRSLTTTNCVPLYLAAYKIERLGVLKACSRFIVVNFQGILTHQKSRFEDLPLESLEQFLALDNLNVSSENQVWTAIVLWVEKAPERRMVHLRSLLTRIRFEEEDDGLATEILDHPLVKDSTYYDELKEVVTSDPPASVRPRIPEIFFVFTKSFLSHSDYSEGIKIYVTYDDQIDIWRNVSSKIFRPDVVLHGRGPLLLMFETGMNIICTFDIVSGTWSTLIPPAIPRKEYNVVKLGSHVYVLGGIAAADDESDTVITTVERYDFDSQRWEFARSHFALSQGAAVAINNTICVVGTISGFFSDFLAAQVYIPDTDTWQAISAPRIYRRDFALVVYQSQLFVLGGHSSVGYLKSVEVYSAEDNEWRQFTELPFSYFMPKAVVIKDVLYAYDTSTDDNSTCPPVFWDEAGAKWEVVESTSPFCDLHIYQFCTVEDSDVIKLMRRENRDAGTKWEGSPFFTYLNTQNAFL